MADILTFLFLIGMVALFVGVVALILSFIPSIRTKSPGMRKTGWMTLLTGGVLFLGSIICLAVIGVETTDQEAKKPQEEKPPSTTIKNTPEEVAQKKESQIVEEKLKTKKAPATKQQETTAVTPLSAEEETPPKLGPPPTIKGSNWVNVTLNFEQLPTPFTFKRRPFSTFMIERCGRVTDPTTAAKMYACVYSRGDGIVDVELTITGANAKPTSTWALPYLASLPFDANKDRAGSKKWVLGAMEIVKTGQPVARTIGDTMMQLIGNPPSYYSLEIQHVDYERWASKYVNLQVEDD